jgi:hypothetical protein
VEFVPAFRASCIRLYCSARLVVVGGTVPACLVVANGTIPACLLVVVATALRLSGATAAWFFTCLSGGG